MTSNWTAQKGFTLIEVLVSLAIVALALSALLASVSQQIRLAGAIQERTYANWVAQNKLTELRLANELPEVSETDDEARFAEIDWALNTNVSETGVENLFRVDVTVSYADSGEFVRTLTGFIGEPGIPGQSTLAWPSGSRAAGKEQGEHSRAGASP